MHTEREIKAAEVYIESVSLKTAINTPYNAVIEAHLAGIQWQKDNAWIAVSSGQLPDKSHQKYSVNVLIWDDGPDDCDIGYYHFLHEGWYDSRGDRINVTHWQPLPSPPKQ